MAERHPEFGLAEALRALSDPEHTTSTKGRCFCRHCRFWSDYAKGKHR